MKISILVKNGIVESIRSDIYEIEIEIVDCDNNPETCKDTWEVIKSELPFENY